jgi:adenine-specific DNA-methyltransferase
VEDLQALTTLVVDSSLFISPQDKALIDEILSDPAFDHLDEQTDGLLIHSENWQALNLLQEKFRERIQCIYIDPPYNTGGDGFLYKDSFRHSSWAAMMADRLALAKPLLGTHGVLFASIDEKERLSLERLLADAFGAENRVEELIWAQNTNKNKSPTYSTNHEYVEVFARSLPAVSQAPSMFREPKPGFSAVMELVEKLNVDYPTIDVIEKEIKALFDQHKVDLTEELEEQGLEYDKTLDSWKGLYNYNRAEYRDEDGKLVSEGKAIEKKASIWIWRESDVSMPQVKQDSQKAEFRDPQSPTYRFYTPKHPITGREVPAPKRGWAWPYNRMEGQTSCFVELDDDHRSEWGDGKKAKIPQIKRYLHETDTIVGKSVVIDYSDGEKDLTAVFGKTRTFASPKPVSLIDRIIQQTAESKQWVFDFFGGSGTTAHAVIAGEEERKFLLSEMGDHFHTVLKPRVARLMFSPHWKLGSPGAAHRRRHIVKVQRLEQYEDVVSNLYTSWDDAAIPSGVQLRYLYRPDQNAVRQSLNLAAPLANTIKAGQDGAMQTVDLLETWALLQGYWVRSRRVLAQGDKRYDALETECGCLVLLRDIAEGEDDSVAVNAIAASYTNADGSARVQRLELNQWADLRKIKLPCTLMCASDFDRGTSWN